MFAFSATSPYLRSITFGTTFGFQVAVKKRPYVVQSSILLVDRCILMATDPADLVVDPTCGSGTTAYVAEQWGRRWITIDTSRVALALARTRLMAARYPWYLLADSRESRSKEAELTRRVPPDTPIHNDLRQGFVYERVPHITLKSIANNSLIDDIWERWQAVLEPLRASLNAALGKAYEEWQIPRDLPSGAPASAKEPHDKWWEARIARQTEIDVSIAARAEVEYRYHKPYVDNTRVRVAGPFTVESLSPHRLYYCRQARRS
jgi:adenine-specific DNA-methyltransferase